MPWVKKAAAPDYLNAVARLRLAMTGTVDDWLLPWINLVDWGTALDVNAFCAAGPPETDPFDVTDFLPAVAGGFLGAAATIFGLREKVNRRAAEILFADLCEEAVTTGETCTVTFASISEAVDPTTPFGNNVIPLQSGTTKIKVKKLTAHSGGVPDMHCHFFNPGYYGEVFDPAGNYGAVGQTRTYTVMSGSTGYQLRTNATGGTYEVSECHPGSTVPFVPPAITQPETAIPPEPGVYTTIADLGAELDAIEQKLHWILNFTNSQLVDRINPLVADDVIVIEEEDEDIALGPNVMGFIVTLTSIPGSADERFGEPVQLHNLGRVVMGNGDAWLPPINLTVTPMLILKPDPTINVARVHTYPPTGATIHTLIRPDPVG